MCAVCLQVCLTSSGATLHCVQCTTNMPCSCLCYVPVLTWDALFCYENNDNSFRDDVLLFFVVYNHLVGYNTRHISVILILLQTYYFTYCLQVKISAFAYFPVQSFCSIGIHYCRRYCSVCNHDIQGTREDFDCKNCISWRDTKNMSGGKVTSLEALAVACNPPAAGNYAFIWCIHNWLYLQPFTVAKKITTVVHKNVFLLTRKCNLAKMYVRCLYSKSQKLSQYRSRQMDLELSKMRAFLRHIVVLHTSVAAAIKCEKVHSIITSVWFVPQPV